MSTHYSNPTRKSEEHALPDVEVFEIRANRALRPDFEYEAECGHKVCTFCEMAFYPMEYNGVDECPACRWGDLKEPGWYWWHCFPGCSPDGEANGPFKTKAEALAGAQRWNNNLREKIN